jgi:hypothetical protein
MISSRAIGAGVLTLASVAARAAAADDAAVAIGTSSRARFATAAEAGPC